MNYVLMVVAIAGLYFMLGMFHGLHTTVGTIAGVTFTYFGILFVVGAGAIIKLCLGK